MRELRFRNRQSRPVGLRLLKQVTLRVVEDAMGVEDYSICVHLIGADEISQLNHQFLNHQGSTDILTFDHDGAGFLYAELFISLDDVKAQAARFHNSWPTELVRCVIHGLLHLQGYDDRTSRCRQEMKRKENSLLKKVESEFYLQKLERSRGKAASKADGKVSALQR